jgi:hypothetical protein
VISRGSSADLQDLLVAHSGDSGGGAGAADARAPSLRETVARCSQRLTQGPDGLADGTPVTYERALEASSQVRRGVGAGPAAPAAYTPVHDVISPQLPGGV